MRNTHTPVDHSTHTHPAPEQRTSIGRRMRTQALILTSFVIVVLTTLSFIISRVIVERSVSTQLSSVAAIAENALDGTLHGYRERATLLTGDTEIRDIVSGVDAPSSLEALLTRFKRDQQALVGMDIYGTDASLIATAGEPVGLAEEALRGPFHRAVVDDSGWTYYDASSPITDANGQRLGYLSLRYDARAALVPLLAVTPSLGDTAELLLVIRRHDELQVFHPAADEGASYMLSLGLADSPSVGNEELLGALDGVETVTRARDYKGRDSLMAIRYLPALGWGLSLQMERAAALQDLRGLAIAHVSIGLLLLVLAAALASLLSGQLTQPLRFLTERVQGLRPGNWAISRSVHSGDEVEILDHVVVDMAGRLKDVYENQEEIIQDRTEALKKQFALDRAILENIEISVITVDQSGRVTASNPAAAKLLGLFQDSINGKQITDVVRLCGHRGNELKGDHPVMESLKQGTVLRSPVNAHFNIRRTDDSLMPVVYAVSPLIDGGKVFGAILVLQDIAEERRLDYLKSEFISLASHQLRTPLSALRWYVELFGDEREKLSEDQRGYLSQMEESITRMVALLTSLLRAAHLEGENIDPEIQSVDMVKLLREVEEDSRSQIHEFNLKCNIVVPDKAVEMSTDPTLVRIVLQNLLSNAVKYSAIKPQSVITLQLAETVDGIAISVKDQGMGIPEDEQKRVFEKFFRAKNVRKQDTDGNGLGLYITRTIVERLNGVITFTSRENEGTVFTVTFPREFGNQSAER